MGELSKIQWTTHTFNPWIGCDKVSAGCKNCYAEVETYSRVSKARGLPLWGPKAARHRTKTWGDPKRWNRKAFEARAGAEFRGVQYERPRVFCASLCDVFEGRGDLDPWRAELWPLIEACDELDWMLLTKRPENIPRMVPDFWLRLPDDCRCDNAANGHVCDGPRAGWPAHVWIGTSVEDQAAANERIPHLLEVPAGVRFLSMEPLLGPVDLGSVSIPGSGWHCSPLHVDDNRPGIGRLRHIDLVIVGGEGHGGRPFDLAWARSIRDQCKAARVAFFFKQGGADVRWDGFADPERPAPPGAVEDTLQGSWRLILRDRKGGDLSEMPADLRVRSWLGAA